MHKNLIVRMVTEDTAKPDPLVLAEANRVKAGDVPLKVLFVFAEAPGSRPLAMRLEREMLRNLFFTEILPKHQVQVDFLCHGVTRATLRDQIQQAGGFIPHMVFLSACLSGAFIDVRTWGQLQSVLTGRNPEAGPAPDDNADDKKADDRILTKVLGEEAGYTGTALTLLRGGVAQVASMRYEVGDAYARELAVQFYRHLLADPGKHTADAALTLARADLLRDAAEAARLGVVNHATPLMFGQPGRPPEPAPRRSDQMNRRGPRPQPLLPSRSRELDPRDDFTGRGRDLTRLNVAWFTPGGPAVALIQGLAGMGKTALAAEAVHLWHPRFDWVFAFQAKPTALQADEFYRQMDFRLTMESATYRDRSAASPYSKIFLEPDPNLPPDMRYERMRRNLIEALNDEAVLLVLDNFETNLKDYPGSDGYGCRDPEWDRLLDDLAAELPGGPSRLLITSRHLPAVLAGKETALWLPLGPLPLMEAALFVRSHPLLGRLIHEESGQTALLHRLLNVSRCHPLIMNRLAALARDPEALNRALDTLESQGLRHLPDLFSDGVSEADREKERDYLEDVAAGAVDYLIERLSPEARRLLWMVTLANEPVTEELMDAVWDGPPVADLLNDLHVSGLLTHEADEGRGEDAPVFSFHELVRERMAEWMAACPAETGGRSVKEIWIAYGERYAVAFKELRTSGRERAMEAASEVGRRALVYMVRAEAYDKLGAFASDFVTGTMDPALLHIAIAELKGAVNKVSPGETRWFLRTCFADAMSRSGRSDQSLAIYSQAAAEAKEAEKWSDLAVIYRNWAIALRNVGLLDQAKEVYLKCLDVDEKAANPEIEIIGRQLEALRIELKKDKAESVLPEIEFQLNKVRSWYRRYTNSEHSRKASKDFLLGRLLESGLDIAYHANLQLGNWHACLSLLDEIEQTKQAAGRSRHEIYWTRFNRQAPLKKLGRLDKALEVVEECLAVFRDVDDLMGQTSARSALAAIWYERGDITQAVALARQSLMVRNRLPNPADRAISHLNLSTYLYELGRNEESMNHHLAAGLLQGEVDALVKKAAG